MVGSRLLSLFSLGRGQDGTHRAGKIQPEFIPDAPAKIGYGLLRRQSTEWQWGATGTITRPSIIGIRYVQRVTIVGEEHLSVEHRLSFLE